MADNSEIETYNLWRYFKGRQPNQVWACTLEKDLKADHGFKVLDFDDVVADSVFWARLSKCFEKPVRALIGHSHGDTRVDEVVELSPKDEGYFGVAVRQLPMATIGPEPGAE